jgi:hypothetical protein
LVTGQMLSFNKSLRRASRIGATELCRDWNGTERAQLRRVLSQSESLFLVNPNQRLSKLKACSHLAIVRTFTRSN